MAGRGRGRTPNSVLSINNFDNLRRPLTSGVPSTITTTTIPFNETVINPTTIITPTTNHHSTESISSKLSKLWITMEKKGKISTAENVEDISKTIRETVVTSEALTKTAVELFNYGLKGKDEATTAALVVKNIEKFTVNEVNLRFIFLNEMGSTFENIQIMRKTNPKKFQNFVVLLCEISMQFPKIMVVRTAMLEALGMLLEEGTNEDIFIFWEEIKKIGPKLITEEAENIGKIMLKARKVILVSQTSNRSRCLLLECLELYLFNFQPLPSTVKTFYSSYI